MLLLTYDIRPGYYAGNFHMIFITYILLVNLLCVHIHITIVPRHIMCKLMSVVSSSQ